MCRKRDPRRYYGQEVNAFELRDCSSQLKHAHTHTHTSLSSLLPYAESRVREF